MTPKEFLKFKEEVESANTKASKAQGAYERDMAQLKERFEVNSIEEGQAILDEIQSSLAAKQKELDQRVAEFRTKWAGKL